ncbi:NAD(P)/FAD-dependent oxidoreductase [Okeania hirsuta]|uniref:NAD(P)/FAD-dependent oxidoreductase n=1 Tax=Okeania hirsuta TaxID=1458930 RepID=UPI000F5417FE|nr:NAD(P)/FAD-dependent oxidoreductase [Okeania hirsuta]RQH15600.1 NAD(P)/FAD-dependent oxidoreductase [Okeania hirsuta]
MNNRNDFNVVVIGAGPAGCQCARSLAKLGRKVLLVEQHETFNKNDFSSAATPQETLDKFDLPETVVGSYWQKISIVTTNVNHTWASPKILGAVLNFAKLREFLAGEVESYGGKVWMGCRYTKNFQEEGKTVVEMRRFGGEKFTVSTEVLVDATGPARAVMYDKKSGQPQFLTAAGIEYLIEVEGREYEKYAKDLIFFLGHKWMPKGYSWIFPMEPEKHRLKIGVARFNLEHKQIVETKSMRWYLELLIKDYMKLEEYELIDSHGSTVRYSVGLKDIYYQDNIIAIGDAVSTINMLGGEGIRHGMDNAEIASKYIEKYLDQRLSSFRSYQREMQRRYAIKWNISEQMGRRRYMQDSDELIDKGVNYLKSLTVEDMMNILFVYNFQKLYKGLGKYLQRKIKLGWQKVQAFSGQLSAISYELLTYYFGRKN